MWLLIRRLRCSHHPARKTQRRKNALLKGVLLSSILRNPIGRICWRRLVSPRVRNSRTISTSRRHPTRRGLRYNARAPTVSFENRLRRFKNCGLQEFDRPLAASMNLSFFVLVILFLSRPAQSVDPYKVPYFLLLGFVLVPLGLGLWLPHLESIQFLFFVYCICASHQWYV